MKITMMLLMKLFSTNPNIPGIGGHVREYSLHELPDLKTDPHFNFLLALTATDLEQHKNELHIKLSDHWVGDSSLVDCIERGSEPDERWYMQAFILPSIADNFADKGIFVYRSKNHKAWIIVRTDLLDQLMEAHEKWWEQGWTIGTVYENFQKSILDYCENLCAQLNAWEPSTAKEARDKKRVISRFKGRWAELGVSPFFERHDHKQRHEAIAASTERAEQGAQNDVEYHTAEETSRPTSIRTSSTTPATNARLLAGLAGKAGVVAIFDSYFDNQSLSTLTDLATLGTLFSPNLRILSGADMAKPGKTRLTKNHLQNWYSEHGITSGELRLWPAKGHQRRFMLLDDGQTLILGCSLNDIAKDEVAHLDTNAADLKLFDSTWTTATVF